jgi:hypothetical protein
MLIVLKFSKLNLPAMNIKTRFTFTIVCFFVVANIVAQIVPQGKVYINDDIYIFPSVENNFAYISINEVYVKFEKDDIKTRFLNINVSKRLQNKISYCLIDNYFFSAIVPNHRKQMGVNSAFVAWSLDSLKLENPKYINDFIKEYKGGDVSLDEMLLINNSAIRTAILEDFDSPLSIDFESNGTDSIYLTIINIKKSTLSLHSLFLKDLQLLIKSIPPNKLPEFIPVFTELAYTGTDCTLAYLKNKLFIIDEHQTVFRVDDKRLTCIYKVKEKAPIKPDDSMVIVDKDNQALYLSSKELLKNHKGTMLDFLKLCTKVPIE